MKSCVEKVTLYEVTLDIGALAEYDGQGECRDLDYYDDTANRYSEQLINLAASMNWEVTDSTIQWQWRIRIQRM